MSDTRSPDDPGDGLPTAKKAVPRQDLMITAWSVERDFEKLVQTVERMIDIVGETDDEFRRRLHDVKVVAQHAHRLSQLLRD